jgi:hypothetical protein
VQEVRTAAHPSPSIDHSRPSLVQIVRSSQTSMSAPRPPPPLRRRQQCRPARHDPDSRSRSSFPPNPKTASRRVVYKDKDSKDSDIESEDNDDDDEHPRSEEGKRPLTTHRAVLASVVGSSHVSLGASQNFLLCCWQ